jgi:hypothetical protein
VSLNLIDSLADIDIGELPNSIRTRGGSRENDDVSMYGGKGLMIMKVVSSRCMNLIPNDIYMF